MNKILLKIPPRLFQTSKELGIQKDVEFYYSLKRINSAGFLPKKGLTVVLREFVGFSEASIYRKLKRLINLKMVQKVKNGYRICSYKKLFDIISGGDPEYRKVYANKKVSILHLSAVKELKEKFRAQAIAAISAMKCDETYQRSFNKTSGNLLERLTQVVDDQLAYMVRQNLKAVEAQEYSELSQSTKVYRQCNPDITLSLKGICKLLGLKSTAQSFKLMRDMESEKLVSIKRNRKVLVAEGVSYFDFLNKFGEELFRYIGRDVYKVLPNKYSF